MTYPFPIFSAVLIDRPNRFLCNVTVDGKPLTVLCPNTGSMAGLLFPGNPVRISGPHPGNRKYPFTLEQIQITRPDRRQIWVGVNTHLPNRLAEEAVLADKIPALSGFYRIRREVKIGEHSRIDLLLESDNGGKCWVEVKNVSLVLKNPSKKEKLNEGSTAAFPDSVTERGLKHLRELEKKLKSGDRAAMIYIIQRSDAVSFAPAKCVDPEYAKAFRRILKKGLEVYPLQTLPQECGIEVEKIIPLI